MSFVRSVVVIGWAVFLGTAAAAAEQSIEQRKLLESWKVAYEKAQHQDCQPSLEILKGVLEHKAFGTLVESERANIYAVASFCATEVKNADAAYRYALEGTRLKAANALLWRARLGLELEGKRYVQATETIEAMASQNPEALNGVPSQWIGSLYRDLRNGSDKTLQRRILVVLAAPSYRPDEVLASTDGFKKEYAIMLADAGDAAAAAELLAQIEVPSVLINASVDPRLRSFLPPDFDGRAVVERRLAQAREVAASHAGSMMAVLEVARNLRLLGRAEDALATLESARPDGPQRKIFTDLDTQENWWWDAMARTYGMLGRYDEAVAALRKGIEAKERGASNVSQTLNLAYAQLRFGHPVEAIATIAAFEAGKYSMSPYGTLVLRNVRGCARLALGQGEAARDDIAYANAHERDNEEALMSLLLCAGDMDGAAAALIRRLDDPDRRTRALLQVSDYDEPPASYPPSPFDGRFSALKKRPDVQAAIKRAGGARRFRLQAEEL